MTPERLDKIREHFTGWTSVDDINNVRYAQDLIAHIDYLTAELAAARAAWDEWKASSRAGHAHASDMAAENARLRDGIEHLTRVGYSHTLDCEAEYRREYDFDYPRWHPDCGRCWEDRLHGLLNPPTEGEDHD